LPILYEDHDPV